MATINVGNGAVSSGLTLHNGDTLVVSNGGLAEDIIVTDPVGRTWDKAKYLAELGTNAWGIDSYELRDISIRVYARAAVVTGRAMVKTNASNPSGTGPYRVTNTYILYDGRWRCVASHNSSLFDQPASDPVFQDFPIIPLLPQLEEARTGRHRNPEHPAVERYHKP